LERHDGQANEDNFHSFNITCFQECVFGVTHLLYRPIGICQGKERASLYTGRLKLHTEYIIIICTLNDFTHTTHRLLGCSELQMKDLVKMAKIVPTHKALTIKTKTPAHIPSI